VNRWALIALAACRYNFDPRADGAPDRPNYAFFTSTYVDSTFGDIANADASCQAFADAAGLDARFIALVGTQSRDVRARVDGSRGWVDVAGVPIVDQPANWFDGSMFHPLRRDERNELVGLRDARIGDSFGDCAGWTSNTVLVSSSIVFSTQTFRLDGTTHECSGQDSLVCIETGHIAAVAVQPQAGRFAFVSAGSFVAGGGLASADALCAGEAAAAGLPGTYLAALGSSAGAAFSRFSLTGPTWVRPDGIPLAATAADVAFAPYLDSFASLHADRSPANYYIWTGDSMNCTDWTTQAGFGTVGITDSVDRLEWRATMAASCTVAYPVLCLQQ